MLLLAAVSLYMPEYEPDALAEATHLNKAHPEGEPDPGSKQKEQKDIVPEKVADTFDQWGKLLHDR